MQVGEEHLALAHPVVLLGDRLLDLEDQVAGRPDLVGGRQDLRAGGDVLLVGDGGADAGAGLDEDLVAVADELVHARRGDRHPVLVVLDLAGDADLHRGTSLRGRTPLCDDQDAFTCQSRWSIFIGMPTSCNTQSKRIYMVSGFPKSRHALQRSVTIGAF